MDTATTISAKVGKAVSPAPVYIPALLKQRMILARSYCIARNRGYAPGYELRDWFEAERIIQERFSQA